MHLPGIKELMTGIASTWLAVPKWDRHDFPVERTGCGAPLPGNAFSPLTSELKPISVSWRLAYFRRWVNML
jgi:hypothetical protein